MKINSAHYDLYLFDEDKPRWLSMNKGEKLAIVLALNDAPKFILVDDDVINTNSIKELERIEDRKTESWYTGQAGAGTKDFGPIEIELTEEEEKQHLKYLKAKDNFIGKPLLKE